jgi:serine/threonine protein kinase
MNVVVKSTIDTCLKRKIGRGTYGNVYEDTLGNAIKIFKSNKISPNCKYCNDKYKENVQCDACIRWEKKQLTKFNSTVLREISIMMVLSSCPYVPQVKEIYFGENIGFSMEKYDCSLRDLIITKQTSQLSMHVIQFIITQLVIVLAQAQRNLILHRDIKPQNIMINANCKTFLIDWGLGTSVWNEDIRQDTREVQTIWYRCIEHILKITSDVNNPSIDIWSVGIIMLEMLRRQDGLLGSNEPKIVISKMIYYFGIPNDNPSIANKLREFEYVHRRSVSIFETCKIEYGLDDDGIDLLKKMLNMNPKKRITPFEALLHPYIASCITSRIPDHIYINPVTNVQELGSYYPTQVSDEYFGIRYKYYQLYKSLCINVFNFGVAEIALMLMYTDKMSNDPNFNVISEFEENVIAISQIISMVCREEASYMIDFDIVFRNEGLNISKLDLPILKPKLYQIYTNIVTLLKFPLAMCSFVTLGYYIKLISQELHAFYLRLSTHVLKNYIIFEYSNEEIYMSILLTMQKYKCNVPNLIEKINLEINQIAATNTFMINITASISIIRVNFVEFVHIIE